MKFPKKFPILKVSDYILREPQKSDAEFYFKSLTDEATIQYTSYDVKSVSEIEGWFLDYKKQFKESKRISWAIEEAATQKVIGEVSFFSVVVEDKKGEIGYFLEREYWGRGIMSQVLKAVIDYLFEELKVTRLQSVVMQENLGSRRLLEKNGFTEEGILQNYKRCRGTHRDFILYSKTVL